MRNCDGRCVDRRYGKRQTDVGEGGAGDPWKEGRCVLTKTGLRLYWRVVAAIGYDLIAVTLLLIGVVRLRATETRLGTLLVRHGLLYVLAACSAHAVTAAFIITNYSPIAALLPTMPTAIIVMMASTRLYVDLVQSV